MFTVRALPALRFFIVAAVTFVLAPFASAGIVAVADATGHCSPNGLTNGGGTICSGNAIPYSLTALLNGTEVLQAVVGTQSSPVYLVNNDTGSTSFSLVFNVWLQSNQFLICQENGHFAGDRCTVSGALGTVGNNVKYGPPPPNGQLSATFTFAGVPAGNFDLTFAGFNNGDSGTLTGTPPSVGCANASNPVTVPGDAMWPLLTYLEQPTLSPTDLNAYGTVVLNIVVDCTGKVISDTVALGSDPLASAVVAAVNNWTYQPYLVNGVPVDVQTTVTVTYSPGKGDYGQLWEWW